MSRRDTKLVVVPVVLLLLLATTAAGLWHRHDNLSGRACQVCHVGHLPALQPTASVDTPPPVYVALLWPALELAPNLDPVFSSNASRAPPA